MEHRFSGNVPPNVRAREAAGYFEPSRASGSGSNLRLCGVPKVALGHFSTSPTAEAKRDAFVPAIDPHKQIDDPLRVSDPAVRYTRGRPIGYESTIAHIVREVPSIGGIQIENIDADVVIDDDQHFRAGRRPKLLHPGVNECTDTTRTIVVPNAPTHGLLIRKIYPKPRLVKAREVLHLKHEFSRTRIDNFEIGCRF